MGEQSEGGEKRTFFGVSKAVGDNPAELTEAFASAAGQAIAAGVIGEGPEGRTAWFEVTRLEVELGNQHPKTVKVTVQGP